MLGRNILHLWVVVAIVVAATGVEVTLASTQADTGGKSDASRLQEVQEEFLNVVGNSTMSIKTVGDLMAILHSQTGQQMGRLLMEGIMLGAVQKDTGALLSNFWTQFQGRLSPELQDILKDYSDFFGGLDLATLPLAWEKLFKKNELGISLAEIPMGQLVDLLQPTASKYGVDLTAFMNSVMGKGENNIRDLIYGALDNLDVMSLVSRFLNSTSAGTSVETIDTNPEQTVRSKSKAGGKPKKGKVDAPLRLFRPLITSLLRENKIDLDADAVLEVLSPLLSGDLLSQAAPILAALGSQAGDGLGPLIGNILGGVDGKDTQKQMGALLGGVGALLGGGGDQRMDLASMMTMASMFLNTEKSNKSNRGKKEKNTKESPAIATKPDLGTLASLAGKLAEDNDIDINSLLETASSLLTSNQKKNTAKTEEIKQDIAKPIAQKPPKEKTDFQKDRDQVTASPKRGSKSKHLLDLVESILLSMQTDKQCNRKIKDVILFSKAFLNKKLSGVGDLTELLPRLVAMSGSDFISKNDLDNLMVTLKRNLAHATWTDLFESLQREEYRESLGRSITPTLADLVTLLASSEVQQRLYEAAVPKIQALFAAYGMRGVTMDNFPELVAPMMGLVTRGWDLPFKPTAFLVPLRNYLQGLREWVAAGLASVHDLQSKEVSRLELSCIQSPQPPYTPALRIITSILAEK
ncbi:hypothetical protein E2C01_006149 [Portunus trituberculatus]|uniref:Uncharacterized protein n=1 Tax=Portunus trituberculatus TaxID=210409 RepID=A0A5B7CYI4_PORTR|nr:hypothetical protein [Portunus trituberculatus]